MGLPQLPPSNQTAILKSLFSISSTNSSGSHVRTGQRQVSRIESQWTNQRVIVYVSNLGDSGAEKSKRKGDTQKAESTWWISSLGLLCTFFKKNSDFFSSWKSYDIRVCSQILITFSNIKQIKIYLTRCWKQRNKANKYLVDFKSFGT